MSILMTEYDYATDIAVKQEEAFAIGIERGIERGAHQKALETAQKLIARGYPADDIADLLGLTISQIQEIQ